MNINISKRGLFLLIYAIVIIILLIYILFIAPDSMFLSKESKELIEQIESKEPREFLTIEEQFEHLKNKLYNYEYNILDSMSDKSYTFKCEGKINATKEEGTCTNPVVEYTESNKKEVFKKINIDYLEPEKIYELIKDINPTIDTYTDSKTYTYNLIIKGLNSDITIISGFDDISEIRITNAYMTYVLKFSNVSY